MATADSRSTFLSEIQGQEGASPTLAVVVISHRTDDRLDQCLGHLSRNFDSPAWKMILVRQHSLSDVDPCDVAISRIPWHAVIRLSMGDNSVEQLINRHRFLAYDFGFRVIKAQACLVLEDDVLLATDALYFARSMFARYGSSRGFRAVNLGSREDPQAADVLTYSLLRFGLHGPAALMPRRTWKALVRRGLLDWDHQGHWDAQIEDFIKSGFVATPNRSRYLDIGTSGTHMSGEANAAYFNELEASWAADSVEAPVTYERRDSAHRWRHDARIYRRKQAIRYNPKVLRCYRAIRRSLRRGSGPESSSG